jgi:hypothetical protein
MDTNRIFVSFLIINVMSSAKYNMFRFSYKSTKIPPTIKLSLSALRISLISSQDDLYLVNSFQSLNFFN